MTCRFTPEVIRRVGDTGGQKATRVSGVADEVQEMTGEWPDLMESGWSQDVPSRGPWHVVDFCPILPWEDDASTLMVEDALAEVSPCRKPIPFGWPTKTAT